MLIGLSQSSLARTDSALLTDAEFWNIYLPHEDPALDGSIGGVLSAPWIPTVRALAEDYSDVRTALQACAFAGLGWMQDDGGLLRHATRLYAQALRETNNALQDPVAVRSDNALACCRLLSLFELFQRGPASPVTGQNHMSDWRSHVEGSCRIVRLRGPERHASEHGIHLYDGVRMTAIIHGLARRQPNSFTTLSWNLPQRTVRDELFDLISVVPELLQQIDHVSSNIAQRKEHEDRSQKLEQGQQLLRRCLVIANNLREWEAKALRLCEENHSAEGPVFSEVTADFSDGRSMLYDVCKAHGYGFFFICAQYWAICTTFYSATLLFYEQLPSFVDAATEDNPTPQLPSWVDPEPHALNIAHTAEYWFSPQAGLWSAQSAAFPVGTALFYLARTGKRESPSFKLMTHAFADCKGGATLRDMLQNVLSTQESREV